MRDKNKIGNPGLTKQQKLMREAFVEEHLEEVNIVLGIWHKERSSWSRDERVVSFIHKYRKRFNLSIETNGCTIISALQSALSRINKNRNDNR